MTICQQNEQEKEKLIPDIQLTKFQLHLSQQPTISTDDICNIKIIWPSSSTNNTSQPLSYLFFLVLFSHEFSSHQNLPHSHLHPKCLFQQFDTENVRFLLLKDYDPNAYSWRWITQLMLFFFSLTQIWSLRLQNSYPFSVQTKVISFFLVETNFISLVARVGTIFYFFWQQTSHS